MDIGLAILMLLGFAVIGYWIFSIDPRESKNNKLYKDGKKD